MTESSYYPLSPLKSPLENTSSPSMEPLKRDSDLTDPPNAVVAKDPPVSLYSKFRTPLHPRLFRKSTSVICPPLWRVVKTPVQMALSPFAAISYLVFCYTVHGRTVPVNTYGLYDVTPQHFGRRFILSVPCFVRKNRLHQFL